MKESLLKNQLKPFLIQKSDHCFNQKTLPENLERVFKKLNKNYLEINNFVLETSALTVVSTM